MSRQEDRFYINRMGKLLYEARPGAKKSIVKGLYLARNATQHNVENVVVRYF